MDIQGELLGDYDEARLDPGPAPGGQRDVLLRFPLLKRRGPASIRCALHLRLHARRPGAAAVNQRAYLLLALGANAGPAVRLFPRRRASRRAAGRWWGWRARTERPTASACAF